MCALHKECLDGDFCTKDLCGDGGCNSQVASCDDADPCTADSCSELVGCIHVVEGGPGCVSKTVLFEATFDDATLQGMVVESLAPESDGTELVTWVPDPTTTHAGAGALYFGRPGPYDYDNGKLVAASATTPKVTLPAGKAAEVRLWVWVDVEPGSDWDVLSLLVKTGDKSLPVWAKNAENVVMSAWQEVVVDLTAFVGLEVQIAVTFNSVDQTFNKTTGAFIDELRIHGLANAKGCTQDLDCDDAIACTEETCEGGVCKYVIGDKCCVTASDCFDGDSCTIDLCGASSTCENIPVAEPGCCNTDADCVDNNPCTHDICQGNNLCDNSVKNDKGCCTSKGDCNDEDKCTIDTCKDFICQNVNTCCLSNAECDDGDDVCTVDTCVDGKCKYKYKEEVAGCLPPCFEEDFGDNSNGWELGPEWEIGPAAATGCASGCVKNASGTDHTPDTDDNGIAGPNIGSCSPKVVHDWYCLTSPEMNMEGSPDVQFVFWREAHTDYPNFYHAIVDVWNGSAWVNLFTKAAGGCLNDPTWTKVTYDVTAHKNDGLKVRWCFKIGSNGVYGCPGWRVDDIKIGPSSCAIETE